MNIAPSRLFIGLALAIAAPLAQAEIKLDEIGGMEIGLEGLVQADSTWFDSDRVELADGDRASDLRRAELVLKGGIGEFDWVVGYDAASDKWLDVNGKFGIGDGHYLQAGQYKQPHSMEELSSTKNNDFISKAAITNTFGTGRRLGVAYGYGNGPWGFTASVFGRELTDDGNRGAGHGLRGTFAPINEDGRILHFGLSYVNRDTEADTLRLRNRPQADLADVRVVDTGNLLDADRLATVGLESVWVAGPLKLQGEYMTVEADRYGAGNDDYRGDGAYLSAVYNLTGETWGYKGGVPTTGKPSEPARGMWQVGLRYDTLDLDDGAVGGGEMDALTAGVNWYWRKNFKLMLDYVSVDSERAGLPDDPSSVQARVQLYW